MYIIYPQIRRYDELNQDGLPEDRMYEPRMNSVRPIISLEGWRAEAEGFVVPGDVDDSDGEGSKLLEEGRRQI